MSKSKAAPSPAPAPAIKSKSAGTTDTRPSTAKAGPSKAVRTPGTVDKSTGRVPNSGRGSRARTVVVPETPLDVAGGGVDGRGASRRQPEALPPAQFFKVVPRPVVVRGGKVDRSMAHPHTIGDVGLRGAPRALHTLRRRVGARAAHSAPPCPLSAFARPCTLTSG